jgi:hypothetical protein
LRKVCGESVQRHCALVYRAKGFRVKGSGFPCWGRVAACMVPDAEGIYMVHILSP